MPQIDPKVLSRINQGREYRQIDISNISLRDAGDGSEMIVEGYATTFDTPYVLYEEEGYRVMEVIDRRAFDNCDMSDVVFLVNHTGRVPARTKNRTLELGTDAHGLYQRAKLNGTEYGRQIYEEIKGGYMDTMSFGFRVRKDIRTREEDHENNIVIITRRITDISKLYDVSAVTFPANPSTEISARSFCEGVIAEAREQERLSQAENIKRQERKEEIRKLLEFKI